jgi:hypothetical protein
MLTFFDKKNLHIKISQTQTRKSIMILGFKFGLTHNFRVWVWVRIHLPNQNLKIEKKIG